MAFVQCTKSIPSDVTSTSLKSTTDNAAKEKSIWSMDSPLEHLFENNKKWVRESVEKDPEVFTRLKDAQQPKYLYIGCSDSRVPAQNMLGLQAGELFVIRNVANLCINSDFSLLSVLLFSVEVLQVTDIIVCGHYGCGGVRAAMLNKDHGLLEHWLHHIRNVQRLHKSELVQIPDEDQRHRRLVELNVQEACLNLFSNPIVQKKQAQDSQPRIHGWVYDIATGYVKDLKIDFKTEIKKYRDIYRLYDFPGGAAAPGMNMGMISQKADETTEALVGAASDPKQLGFWGRIFK
jgi:carbonic anhydrase